jgi:hypothetical protein
LNETNSANNGGLVLGGNSTGFIKCTEIDDTRFEPEGAYYKELKLDENPETLCPADGTIHFNGAMGTSLWVVPTISVEEWYMEYGWDKDD